MRALAREAPDLRCELVEAEPEPSLPALALGDVDLVLADEWQHHPPRAPPASTATTSAATRCTSCCRRTTRRRSVTRARCPWRSSPATPGRPATRTGWEEITNRTCRQLGGFDPDIRHRTNDSVTSLALVADGQAVALLPRLVRTEAHRGVAVRRIAEGSVDRTIFAATRTADA